MAMYDNKQHINLSDMANTVISEDRATFSYGKEIPLSSFVSTILKNYHEQATASISLRCEEYAGKLTATLGEQANDALLTGLVTAY